MYGPDRPRNWTTAHPTLLDNHGAHEARATMRMHRAGWPPDAIRQTLKLSGEALIKQLKIAQDEEGVASREYREIYDAKMPKGAT
jgi:hypothetical protein